MLLNLGLIIVILSIIVGFLAEGGNIFILFQPYAALIILGTAFGTLLLSNPKSLLKSIWESLMKISQGNPYHKEDYLEVLTFMFYFFKYSKSKGLLEIEIDIENPNKSPIFKEFPSILKKREAVIFLCDYMRMLTVGYSNSFELENLMSDQIYVRRNHTFEVGAALHKLADALPALGIIAAVLGVINAMSSINAAPEVLGHKIGAALIGTFIGISVSYCAISPLASFIDKFGNDEAKFLECIKSGFIAYAKGCAPTIAVEFARQVIPTNLKPSFYDLERAIELQKQKRKMIKKNVGREFTAA